MKSKMIFGSLRLASRCRSSMLIALSMFMCLHSRGRRRPGEGRDPLPRWIPAFAGMTKLWRILIRIDDGAQHDAALGGVVVAGAAVHRRALVPHDDVADPPGMIIDEAVLRRMRRQFLDQRPGFLALHADDAVAVHRVDEED